MISSLGLEEAKLNELRACLMDDERALAELALGRPGRQWLGGRAPFGGGKLMMMIERPHCLQAASPRAPPPRPLHVLSPARSAPTLLAVC